MEIFYFKKWKNGKMQNAKYMFLGHFSIFLEKCHKIHIHIKKHTPKTHLNTNTNTNYILEYVRKMQNAL